MYQALKDKGVSIYNQSFGIDGVVTDFNSNSTSSHYYGHQIGSDLLNFYKTEVNNGLYSYGQPEMILLTNSLHLKGITSL